MEVALGGTALDVAINVDDELGVWHCWLGEWTAERNRVMTGRDGLMMERSYLRVGG